MPDKMTELKPCPFCGNTHIFLYSPNGGYAWVVSCEHDGCMMRTMEQETKQEAIRRWNRRAV